MKRVCVLCVALFVLVMALPAMATMTRVMTMGDQYMFIQDDYNIWTFTSTVNNYPRHLIVDHGQNFFGDVARVGVITPFMKSGVLGAFVSDDSFTPEYGPMAADQRLDLFYGYRAVNFDLGVHVDWWGDKYDSTGTQSTSALGLQVGVGFNANGNMFEADVFYKNLNWTYEDVTTGTALAERDAGAVMGGAARLLWAYNNMVTIVPALAVAQYKEGVTNGPEYKETIFDIGAGCNTVPLQGTEFLTSIGMRAEKETTTDSAGTDVSDDKTNTTPYIKFGADIQVKPWLNFRVGAQKNVLQTQEDAVTNEKWTNSDMSYEVGAGIMLGDVQFDAMVNNSFLNAGPYLLSGTSAGPMFWWLSFKYDFR